MSYQSGSVAVSGGQTLVEVTFPSAFAAVPELVVPVFENDADAPQQGVITAMLVAKSESGFTVLLSQAPPAGSHALAWTAGSAVLQLTPSAYGIGRLLPDYDRLHTEPGVESDLPVVERPPRGGRPVLKLLSWGTLRRFFAGWRAQVPSSPNEPAERGEMFLSGAHVYFRTSDSWGRLPLQMFSWDPNFVEGSARPQQEGEAAIPQGATTLEVVFPSPFPLDPWVFPSVINTTDTTPVTLGVVVTRSLKGRFAVRFSAATPTANYRLRWMARCAEPAGQAGLGGPSGTLTGAAYLKTEADARFLRAGLLPAHGFIASATEAGVPLYRTAGYDSIVTRLGNNALQAVTLLANRFLATNSSGTLAQRAVTDASLAMLAWFQNPTNVQLVNGANTLANPTGTPIAYERRTWILRQPLAGAAATVTLGGAFLVPSDISWALSATNGFVDVMQAIWHPTDEVWYVQKLVKGYDLT